MSTIESQHAAQPLSRSAWANAFSKLSAAFGLGQDNLVQRLAGLVFLIRVVSAVLAYGSQVLLARWMGGFEFGIDLGLASAAQRLVPEYVQHDKLACLRGFLSASRWLSMGVAAIVAGCGAVLVKLLEPWIGTAITWPLYVACATLPAYAMAQTQGGIARSYDWMGLALAPAFIFRQLLLTAIIGVIYFAGIAVNAFIAMLVSGSAVWVTALATHVVLNRRLAARVEQGPKRFEFGAWFTVALPIALVEVCFLLLSYVDILVLQQFVSPDQVAIYYAALKTLALVAFIHFAVSATTLHRFSQYHSAGDRQRLSEFLAQAIRWTFWPSAVATALLLVAGRQLLNLFGEQFAGGYHLMFILAVGLLARASVGPIERLLSIVGEWRVCALVYCAAFALNFGLCLVLIPWFGATGAAVASASAIIGETALLFVATKVRLGLYGFVWRW